jgi:peptidoglycan DL-endopeptidase LytE
MRSFYFLFANFVFIFFLLCNVYADTTYKVHKGDNPYTIAKKFKVSPQDIIKANNLKPHSLKPGTVISIPSKQKDSRKNKLAKKHDRTGAHSFSRTAGNGEDPSVHMVKKGETLYSLSRKYSISISELKELNNIKTKKLKPGQQLIVKRSGPVNTKAYTVKKGDNIFQIAKKYAVDVDELREINSLETDILKPGQKILLEPEPEKDDPKNYEAILSQGHNENGTENIQVSTDLNDKGMQERLILFAKKMLDIPYRFGGNTLLGIDCSAYVKKVYSLIGVNLPRSAREQFREGMPVDGKELSTGDLVFFKTYASFPSHVGIYLGNNLFIHASSRSRKVTIDSLETPYYFKRFIGAKRFIELKDLQEDSQKEG